MEINDFLKMLYREDKKWREELAKKAFYEPYQFNPLRFMRRDEMGLSRILAFFLDPKETHAQQDLFLNAFLKKLKLHHFLAYDKVIVETEKMLKAKNGRHDIFIQGILKGNVQWVISIENKLNWASDQPEQIESYISDMKDLVKSDDYFMLYLPVYTQDPSENSISKDKWKKEVESNNAMIWDTKKVIEWLDSCLLGSTEVKQFVTYFIKYLNEEVLGMNETSNKLVDLIVSDDKNIKMALEVIAVQEELYGLLIDKLQKDLTDRFNKCFKNKSWCIDYSQNVYERWVPLIEFMEDENSSYSVFLEFDKGNYQYFYYGIYLDNNVENFSKLDAFFSRFSYSSNENNERKLYWKSFDSNRNWDSETWAKIPSGQLADEIWQEIEPMLKEVVELEL